MSNKLLKKRKNSFTLVQFKKMMGKNLIGVYNGIVLDKKAIAVEIKKIKENIINGSIRQICLIGYINDSGILYIFNGVEKLYVIANISYSDIKKYKIDIEICIVQYPKLDKATIEKLL